MWVGRIMSLYFWLLPLSQVPESPCSEHDVLVHAETLQAGAGYIHVALYMWECVGVLYFSVLRAARFSYIRIEMQDFLSFFLKVIFLFFSRQIKLCVLARDCWGYTTCVSDRQADRERTVICHKKTLVPQTDQLWLERERESVELSWKQIWMSSTFLNTLIVSF